MMIMIPVDSSNLAAVGYDAASAVLRIAFHSGGVYQYAGVPETVYQGLMNASSKGRYFHAHIRNAYRYMRC